MPAQAGGQGHSRSLSDCRLRKGSEDVLSGSVGGEDKIVRENRKRNREREAEAKPER